MNEQQQRELAALPHIINQRNDALNAMAVLQGDIAIVQAQLTQKTERLAEVEKELHEALQAPAPTSEMPAPKPVKIK